MIKQKKELPVAVVGAGMIRFGELFDQSYDDMIVGAYRECLKSVDKGVDEEDIEAAWFGTCLPGATVRREAMGGAGLAEPLRFYPRPVTRIENYCGSGSDSCRNAAFAVAAGIYDLVLVLGAEKMRDIPSRDSIIAQVGRGFHNWWAPRGSSSPQRFGSYALAHMKQFGTKKEHFAMIAVKNHHHASLNPKSYFQNDVTLEQVMNAPIVSWPLGIFDACPTTDGAAAVLLTRPDKAHEYTDRPMYFWGTGVATDPFYVSNKKSYVGWPATEEAARQAYEMAGIGPEDIDLAELHDCFTSTELITYEDIGFCKKGEGPKWLEEGHPMLDGDKPCNTSGGLKGKGHPIGATGVAQIVELWQQLRGEAGERQIKNAHIGLTHNLGGIGSICVINVFGDEPR